MYQVLTVLALAVLATASDVIELGDSDFASRMEDIDLALVKFYAPWCGHCKKMAPEFDKASTTLKNDDPPVALVKVDCTEGGKDTCGKYGVSGYPTLKAFKKGEHAFDYSGPRDADGIVKHMRSKAGPTAKQLDTVEAAEAFVEKPEAVLMGFFTEEDSKYAKTFKKVADVLNEDFRFGYTMEADVMEKFGYKDAVVIFRPKVMQNKFEDSQVKYEGDDWTTEKLKKWVNSNVHGLAGVRTASNGDQFQRPLVVAFYDVDYVKNAKGTNYWRNRVMKVAQKIQEDDSSVYFAISNKDDFAQELGEFGASMDSDKPVVTARDTKDRKFTMTKDFSMDNLEQFVRDFLAGKLEPYLKSEDIPKDNSGPVKTVVAKNFDAIVNDESKDVLIEFYAPWCGHCKSLAPKYEELGEKLQKESSIVIAKMDATANDVPKPYEVSGFPTLYFAPKDKKSNPKKYNGGREVDDFLKYLAKESTDGLTGFDKNGKKIKKKKAEL